MLLELTIGLLLLPSAPLGQPMAYHPCDFAKLLLDNFKSQSSDVQDKIPWLVCVAGYQDFDPDYKAGDTVLRRTWIPEWENYVEEERYAFQGTFALSRDHYEKFEEGNSSVPEEALYFLKEVVHFGKGSIHPNFIFFQKICSGEYVHSFKCRFDGNEPNYIVPIPIYPKLLTEARKISSDLTQIIEKVNNISVLKERPWVNPAHFEPTPPLSTSDAEKKRYFSPTTSPPPNAKNLQVSISKEAVLMNVGEIVIFALSTVMFFILL